MMHEFSNWTVQSPSGTLVERKGRERSLLLITIIIIMVVIIIIITSTT